MPFYSVLANFLWEESIQNKKLRKMIPKYKNTIEVMQQIMLQVLDDMEISKEEKQRLEQLIKDLSN